MSHKDVRACLEKLEDQELPPVVEPKKSGGMTGGIKLTGKQLLKRKPAESTSTLIQTLTKGMGYSPKMLSQKWGVSQNTIRKHAKDMDCLRYAGEDGQWTEVVVHPETAKQMGGES